MYILICICSEIGTGFTFFVLNKIVRYFSTCVCVFLRCLSTGKVPYSTFGIIFYTHYGDVVLDILTQAKSLVVLVRS